LSFFSEPAQQPAPQYKILNSSTLLLTWSPPDYPNGIILSYLLFRDGKQIFASYANCKYTRIFFLLGGTVGKIGGTVGKIGGTVGKIGGTVGKIGGIVGKIGGTVGKMGGTVGKIGGTVGKIGGTVGEIRHLSIMKSWVQFQV
jgi:hypothetical protein